LHIAKIAVSAATYSIDKPYDYTVPEEMTGLAIPGMRVLVPFGSGNRRCEGVILSVAQNSGQKNLKAIDSLLDESPVLFAENLKLAFWMSDRFFCTVYDALRSMLPAGMWFTDGARRLGDKTQSCVTLKISAQDAIALANDRRKSAPKQSAVLQLLAGVDSIRLKDLCAAADALTPAPVKSLEQQGILTITEQEVLRRPDIRIVSDPEPILLNEEQQSAFDGLALLLRSRDPEAALLHGVTGSGKTPVYIKLIEEALGLGKTAIVLVPEIALTPQVVSIFASYFKDSVAVLHSALGVGERVDEWKRISSGAVKVVVGTRSAVFAPLRNIGLIVLDEEQEHTYKSENSPRYHARDIAKYRVVREGALLLLSSATPSVESMFSAKTGKYKLFTINSRYNKKELPSVLTVDMKKELKNGNGGSISSVLRRELELNLKNEEQTILFINRRGANTLVACGECGFTYQCDRCSVSMTYHSATDRLLCHYCGFSLRLPHDCPECKGKLKFIGAGTQRVEAELLELFPGIDIIRMDADTVSRRNSHDMLLSSFREKKASVLLGTQMVAKGLDFEGVTLVGVISADALLYMGDFRAHERTFALLTQVVGRSGRGEKTGRALIQTFTPGHDVITLASKQDYDSFYEREMILRRTLGSPPVNDLLSVMVSGPDEPAALNACSRLREALAYYFRSDDTVKLLGPATAPVFKLKNRFRYRLLLSCENSRTVRDTVAHSIKEFSRDKRSRGVSVFADAYTYD